VNKQFAGFCLAIYWFHIYSNSEASTGFGL
jgi:hypothetical protein